MMRYRVAHLLLPAGWASPGFIEVDDDGTIAAAGSGRPAGEAEHLDGYVVPGMPNLHSHAHQRALAGWADRLRPGSSETLWSWRERMYRHVLAVSPEGLQAAAEQAYLEMVRAGFTSVGEFHYVHHDPGGRGYANPAEMSERIVAAAHRVGIGLTLVPALYAHGGVGRPPDAEQRRFVNSVDRYLELMHTLRARVGADGLRAVAVAPHSLRAVAPAELHALLAATLEGPVHIHVSERTEEVEEVRAGLGAPPVAWLLANVDLDQRWVLIHATHTDEREREGVIRAGAVVGLCPLTEANLGDGLFALGDYGPAGGRWGVGSDANHLIDLTGELRTLEYGQRVRHHRRDLQVRDGGHSAAEALFTRALDGGARALAQPVGAIAAGTRADLVELDPEHPALAGQSLDTVLDAWVFSSAGPTIVRNVMVDGRWVVRDGHHEAENQITRRFRTMMQDLDRA